MITMDRTGNITSLIDPIIDEAPEHAAFRKLVAGRRVDTSYQELACEIEKKARGLKALGIGYKDRVLILEDISTSLYSTLLAVLRVGAVALFVDSGKNLDRLNSKSLKAVIASGKYALISSTAKSVRELEVRICDGPRLPFWKSFQEVSDSKDFLSAAQPVPMDHPALITFTSGTSGRPREIVRTHGFLSKQLKVLTRELDLKKETVELTALPMFVLANLAVGATTIISASKLNKPGQTKGSDLKEELSKTGATSLLGSPSLVKNLVEYCTTQGQKLPRIKSVFTGGGCVDLNLIEKARVCMPNARFTVVYGSSEVEPIAHLDEAHFGPFDRAKVRAGAGLPVGAPVAGISVKIFNQDQSRYHRQMEKKIACLQKMESLSCGEILVSGDHVVTAKDSDSDKTLYLDGVLYHRTGDYGYLDQSGRIWVTGLRARKNLDCRFSFALEQMAKEELGKLSGWAPGKLACLREADGETILYLEKGSGAVKEPAQELEGISKIKRVKRIPVDPRHNTKVLYRELRGLGRSFLSRLVILRDQGLVIGLLKSINLRSRNAHGS